MWGMGTTPQEGQASDRMLKHDRTRQNSEASVDVEMAPVDKKVMFGKSVKIHTDASGDDEEALKVIPLSVHSKLSLRIIHKIELF